MDVLNDEAATKNKKEIQHLLFKTTLTF